jgi:pimeloyl-ACP methyl ester carboxylesterase
MTRVYEAVGDGAPVILLASPLARAKTYRPTADCLAKIFRVMTVELPGSGHAAALGAGWSVEQFAEWVAGFIAALGLDRPIVIGHSHSGPIGVRLAARHAHLVGRLVLVDATGTGPHSAVRVFTAGLLDLVLEIGIVLGRWHHVVGNLFLHPWNFLRQVRDATTVDVRTDAAQVTAPALVAWGCRDHAFPPRHVREYTRCLPDGGAAGGAAAGAAAGSLLGPMGAAVGALVGGVGGAVLGKDAAKGSQGKTVPALKKAAKNVVASKPVKKATKAVATVAKKGKTAVKKAVTGGKSMKATKKFAMKKGKK